MTSEQLCPKCDAPMVERVRRSDGKHFYGCSRFPRCRSIVNINGQRNAKPQKRLSPIKRELKSIAEPSVYQSALFDAIEAIIANKTRGNIIVSATAGSGKTASCEHIVGLVKKLDKGVDMIYLVFNKLVQVEAESKGLPAKTTHSKFFADYRAWMKGRGRVQINTDKTYKIVQDLLHDDYGPIIDEYRWMISQVCKIVSLVKNTLSETTNEALAEITRRYPGIDLNDSEYEIYELVRRTLKVNNRQLNSIDFDDMLYLPYVHNIPVKQYDWVIGDEVQDWNALQIALIQRTVKDTGNVIIVGDRNQSMYGFRGAAVDSMDRLKDAFEAEEMPLSISYRNPRSHVALVNDMFPHIAHEVWDKAEEGEILDLPYEVGIDMLQSGDLVLSRTNAPLIRPAFAMLRQGKKVVILGRDIATNLINLIEKHRKGNKLQLTLDKLEEYTNAEWERLNQRGRGMQAETALDKFKTIDAIAEECKTVDDLINRIDTIFSDTLEGTTFSSVHKAKGAEADNVAILTEAPMPHPMAQSEDELQQEQNIKFVAVTRAKQKLMFIAPAPKN